MRETATRRSPLSLGRHMKPAQKHRPAVWENMLGTVYAMSPDREIRYFDYDWVAALDFAEIDLDDPAHDLRHYRITEQVSYGRSGGPEPRYRQWVLWAKD